MSNEVVKYHNDLNTVVMRNWTSEEMNLFFSIIAKIRDKGVDIVEFNTNELKEISGFANEHKQRWEDNMTNVAEKITRLSYIERTTKRISVMTLFNRFDIFPDERRINVQISTNFEYIVNKITANFTVYELTEFTQIRSTYAKTMYRILKQWRTIGKKTFDIDVFKKILDMPDYYKPSHINKNVLTPIIKELPKYFKNLNVKAIKANTQGTPVIAYKFTWDPEKVPEKPEFVDDKYIKNTSKKRNVRKIKNKKSSDQTDQKFYSEITGEYYNSYAEKGRAERFLNVKGEKQ